MGRLIDADAMIEKYNKKFVCKADCISENKKLSSDFRFFCRLSDAVESAPTVDAVPRGAVEQLAWERDLAVQQLKSIGKGLGEKMDDIVTVKHGHWEDRFGTAACSECGQVIYGYYFPRYCPCCGAKMDYGTFQIIKDQRKLEGKNDE